MLCEKVLSQFPQRVPPLPSNTCISVTSELCQSGSIRVSNIFI